MVNANASPLQTQSPILKGMQKKKACAESYMLFTTIKMTLKGLSATTKKKRAHKHKKLTNHCWLGIQTHGQYCELPPYREA